MESLPQTYLNGSKCPNESVDEQRNKKNGQIDWLDPIHFVKEENLPRKLIKKVNSFFTSSTTTSTTGLIKTDSSKQSTKRRMKSVQKLLLFLNLSTTHFVIDCINSENNLFFETNCMKEKQFQT